MPTDWQTLTARVARRFEASGLTHLYRPVNPLALVRDPGTWFYLLTLVAEVPAILARTLVVILAEAIVFTIMGWSLSSSFASDLLNLALVPTVWSFLALIGVWGGGTWWRASMGGRAPSERERLAYEEALQTLRGASTQTFTEPTSWFVYDLIESDACVCGGSLALSRGLLESVHLEAVLAHELGHLCTSDGRLTAALNRLVLFKGRQEWEPQEAQDEELARGRGRGRVPVSHMAGHVAGRLADEALAIGEEGIVWFERVARLIGFLVRMLFRLARGGLALRVIGRAWASYWRSREYAADAFAVALGQGEELAVFLQTHALINDRPVPFIWLSEESHPSSELRIDRIAQAMAAMEAGGGFVAPEVHDDAGEVIDADGIDAESVEIETEPVQIPPVAGPPQAQVAQEPGPVKRGRGRSVRSRAWVAALDRTRPLRLRQRSGPGREGPARSAGRARR